MLAVGAPGEDRDQDDAGDGGGGDADARPGEDPPALDPALVGAHRLPRERDHRAGGARQQVRAADQQCEANHEVGLEDHQQPDERQARGPDQPAAGRRRLGREQPPGAAQKDAVLGRPQRRRRRRGDDDAEAADDQKRRLERADERAPDRVEGPIVGVAFDAGAEHRLDHDQRRDRKEPDERHPGAGANHRSASIGRHRDRPAEREQPERRQDQPEGADLLGDLGEVGCPAALADLDQGGVEPGRDLLRELGLELFQRLGHQHADVGEGDDGVVLAVDDRPVGVRHPLMEHGLKRTGPDYSRGPRLEQRLDGDQVGVDLADQDLGHPLGDGVAKVGVVERLNRLVGELVGVEDLLARVEQRVADEDARHADEQEGYRGPRARSHLGRRDVLVAAKDVVRVVAALQLLEPVERRSPNAARMRSIGSSACM